ncbi:MAG TPA: hypothetical protein DEV87_04870 [Clostridiales bacterium]|nr:hypothetical protein [Clostridiales bacterium]
MITIIFGVPRVGKTCYMTHILTETAFDRERNRAMRTAITDKINGGFERLTIPQHCVSANYDLTMKKFGYSPRYNRLINPYRLGYANEHVKTHFNFPYEAIGIDEAQKYLNSRAYANFPEWQSRWYEQHGHNHLDIYLAAQRPKLIDVNIRELARFEEIVRLDKFYDRNGRIKRLKWVIREIDNCAALEAYMESGKKDRSLYALKTVTADYNVFDCYKSTSCEPEFYRGHMSENFDLKISEPIEDSYKGYIKYQKEHEETMPKGYLKKSGGSKNDKGEKGIA